MKLSWTLFLTFNVVCKAVDVDCFDGNNGGCSHYCAVGSCACPSCWEMQPDLVTCEPLADKIAITCAFDAMTIAVDQCVFTDGNEAIVIGYSDDAACQSTNVNGTLTVTTPFDGCGVTNAMGDDVILFSNTLSVRSRTSTSGIITAADVDIPVECAFDTSVSGVGSSNVVEAPSSTSGTSGTGDFTFIAEYYTSADFDSQATGTEPINVGQTLFFGVRPSTVIQDVRFYVNKCTVSDDLEHSYDILDEMCPNDFIVSGTSGFINTELFTMNHMAFQFMGNYLIQLSELF